MAKIILFNKPFEVLSQFTDSEGRTTLADFIPLKDVYAAGRLDRDSEGLMVLTDEGAIQHQIADPRHKMAKTYWAQVEGCPSQEAIAQLCQGVELKDGITRPASARLIDEPDIWPRTPPIRQRANIPTRWIELTIKEGKNRQVRRMTAAIGHPTLRLIRTQIGAWKLGALTPGEWKTEPCPNDLMQTRSTTKKNARRQHPSHKHTQNTKKRK